MDRRSFLFVLGLTALFFLMNQWFYKDHTVSEAPDAGTHIERAAVEVPPKTLSPQQFSKFHIASLYEDIDLQKFAGYAIDKETNFLSLAWKRDMPQEIFTQTSGVAQVAPQRLLLRADPEGVSLPVLYSIYSLSRFSLPYIPSEGNYDIHLLYFEEQTIYHVKGKTFGQDKVVLESLPPKNAFVFFEYDGEIVPYAFYESGKPHLIYLDKMPVLENYAYLTFPQEKNLAQDFAQQKFYVLENPYVQLVFSNLNGSLAEINLPFHSESNQLSVVRPIEFDYDIEKHYPFASLFPLSPYTQVTEKGTEQKQPVQGGFYPLLRRSIDNSGGPALIVPPHFYAFTIFEDENDPRINLYSLTRFEKNLIEFQLSEPNRKITKTFSLPQDPTSAPYCVDLEIKIEGDARHLHCNMGIPEVELISGNSTPNLKYQITKGHAQKLEEIKPPKEIIHFTQINPNWFCNGNGFLGIIAQPLTKLGGGFGLNPVSGDIVPTRLSVIDAEYHRFPNSKYPGYSFHLPLSSKPGVTKLRLFTGPFDKKILTKVDQTYTNPKTKAHPNYVSCQDYPGRFSFLFEPVAKFLFFLLNSFYKLVHSWGIAIILLTVAIRVILYPVHNWSMKSMAKMQRLSPKLTALQEKYKKDPQKLRTEQMKLYQQEGANPFAGCLIPMLVQIPFLFGMLNLLKSSFALRGVPFIPGWITNLTAPDILFSWSYPIFFFGTSFHLLPFLSAGAMYLQQKISQMSSSSTAPLTDQQKQQRWMMNVFSIVFSFMLYNVPSGLNLYWIFSTLLGIIQQVWVNKHLSGSTKKG